MARQLAERGYSVDRYTLAEVDMDALPGFSPVMDTDYARAVQVVGTRRAAAPTGRSLIIQGHVDVVPTGPAELWSTPPFEPAVRGEWLHGRGAGDMKQGVSAMVFALDAIRDAGLEPAADIAVQSVTEEECTGNGALSTLARGYRADAVLIPEPTDATITRAHVGVMWFRLRVRGVPVHVAQAQSGTNAIMSAYQLILALQHHTAALNAGGAATRGSAPSPTRSSSTRASSAAATGPAARPAWCEVDCRIGLLPGASLEEARAGVQRCVAAAARADGFMANNPPDVVWNGFQADGYVLEPGSEAERVLAEAHQAVFGAPMEDRCSTAVNDTRFYGLYHRMPALCYGPRGENHHGFDERAHLADAAAGHPGHRLLRRRLVRRAGAALIAAAQASGRLRYGLVALLVLAGCVNFIDRSAVSIALPAIRADLHLSEGEAGLLLSAFAWSYAVAQLPAGSLVDRLGTRWALAGALAAWSGVQALSGLAGSLPRFIAARVALGLGEAPMFVGGARVIADRFDPADRAVPLGLLNASASLGPAIAPLLLTPLMLWAGWRAGFAAMGAAGLLVAVLWAVVCRDPAGKAEAPRVAGPRQWLALLRQRTVWGLLIGFGGTVYMTWLYVTWLPGYLVARWGMAAERAALWSALPQFAGFVGAVGGGWLSDRLAPRLGERVARQGPLVAGLFAAAAGSAVAAGAGSAASALAAISVALFAANAATTSGWALAASLAPAALVATVEAMANIGGSIGGSLAPLVTGYAVQRTGSFTPALLIAAAVAAACAGANWVLTRGAVTSPHQG